MNTGLSDAFNLIWRLHFLLQYPSLPSSTAHAILSSYDIERRKTAEGVIDIAAKLVRSTLADAKGYVDLIEKNAGFITGMGVHYSDVESPLVHQSEHGVWKAGHRAPDLWLAHPATGDAVRLYQKLTYGCYFLVLVGAPRNQVQVLEEQFATLIRLTGLKALGVGARRRDEDAVEEEVHTDAYGCSWVKRGEEYAVLVRPDCFVEFVGGVERVVAYVQKQLPGLFSSGK